MDRVDRLFFGCLIALAVIAGWKFGKDFARNFLVREAQRCIEAPDIDTARVCWDAATLGWKP